MDLIRELNVDLGKAGEEASEGEERIGHETEHVKAAQEEERERKTSQQAFGKSDVNLEALFGRPSTFAREPSQQKDHKIEDDLESLLGHPSISAREPSSHHTHDEHDDDLEAFFALSSTSASYERQRPTSTNNFWNIFSEPTRTASGPATPAASTNNPPYVFCESTRTVSGPTTPAASVDEWITVMGSVPSSHDSQGSRRKDTGESSSRKNDRLARTRESTANAVSELRRRDEELQRQQAEKQRVGVVLEAEIKRWSGGKDGNLRALLSTLHDVLWPECGWTSVSLSDLIEPAAVKKTYRKAMLHVHPDKVQQKGATAQQQYIAENIFELLKEAFSKFSSEELF